MTTDEIDAVRRGSTERRPQRTTARLLGVAIVLVLLLQRFAIPVGDGGVPLVLVLVLGIVGPLVLTGALTHDVTRMKLFLAAGTVCAATAWVHSLRADLISVNSLLLLLVIYVPWLFKVSNRSDRHAGGPWALRLYVRVMVLAGGVAIIEMAAQISGLWSYVDPFEGVPAGWILGDYNTNQPVEYGSPIIKSQAFVFLEPSFLSQFLGLALVIGILQRAPAWNLVVLGVALICTYSGTGLILAGVGLLIILIRVPRRIRPGMVLLAVVTATIFVLSPYAEPLLERTDEVETSDSSLSLRFVAPYREVVNGLSQEPVRYLVGAGPGSAERVLENAREGSGLAVVYTVVPKIIFEYGLIGGSLFLAFFLATILRRPRSAVLPGTLAVMLLFLSGSLLQPHTLLIAWLLAAVWSPD